MGINIKPGDRNTMDPVSIVWLKASDGTAAADMQVALVTTWTRCGMQSFPSYQNVWGAGPSGTFSMQFSNVPNPVYSSTPTDVSASDYSTAPTQPTGAADNNILAGPSIAEYVRELYTPTSGGTAVLPTGHITF